MELFSFGFAAGCALGCDVCEEVRFALEEVGAVCGVVGARAAAKGESRAGMLPDEPSELISVGAAVCEVSVDL